MANTAVRAAIAGTGAKGAAKTNRAARLSELQAL
jgi:hypothetical protein